MKNNLLYIFVLTSLLSFAQTEEENYARVSKLFSSEFNAENYEAIFNMFDASMQKALPKEQTLAFFKFNVVPAGKIEKMEFSELKQTAHIYKTTFEKGIFDILISLDAVDKINGLYVKPHIPKSIPVLERNISKMSLPFKETWNVSWGGITETDNYHVAHNNQKYAYDLLIQKDGKTFDGDAKKNESYFAYGKKITAPCDATVVKVIRDVKDNIPGELNPEQLTGNTIVLKTANNEFIMMAHFKENSIRVMENQIVSKGDIIGLCGNSGNSSEAHLHISLQNVADMNIATGGKLFFDTIKVNGKIKKDYIPVKNDKIQNSN